jgi:hypothetical protein
LPVQRLTGAGQTSRLNNTARPPAPRPDASPQCVEGMPSAKYYLKRGLRSVDVALPVHLLADFDRRVAEVSFRSRNSMLAEAILHFMTCERANWQAGDQPSRGS